MAGATVLASQLDRISTFLRVQLLTVWDGLSTHSVEGSLAWHDAVKPVLSGAASASLDLSTAYLSTIGADSNKPSPLLVADAAARSFDPFDVLGNGLNKTGSLTYALQMARNSVETLADGTVMRTARRGIGQIATTEPDYVRRANPGACDWCLGLTVYHFPTAAAAEFGHDHCGCLPVPVDEIGDHNRKLIAKRGGVKNIQRHSEAASLRGQIRTAQARQKSAHKEFTSETDPARRERLSIREQDWETRVEAAQEQLRIVLTGTHRLPA